jgi:hypothetical protein
MVPIIVKQRKKELKENNGRSIKNLIKPITPPIIQNHINILTNNA